MSVNNKIKEIKEAVGFIQCNWITGDTGVWRGEASDFVGATLENKVTKSDVRNLVKVINSGEPTPLECMGGTISKNEIMEVWVSKCME